MTSPVPEGMSTITPSLVLKNAARAIETYEKALGAKVIARLDYQDGGKVMHAVLEIGDSKFFIGDETPNMKAMPAALYLYLPDVDQAMARAVKAGMKEIMPAQDMFWGDRLGAVEDEFGIQWSLATHTRDVSDEEIKEVARKFQAEMKECGPGDKAA